MRADEATRTLPGAPALNKVVGADGKSWLELRRSLVPRFRIVWRDIAICYLSLAAGIAFALLADGDRAWGVRLVIALVVSLWWGFWLHALSNFGHEAAHFNLAPGREVNDRLANIVVWSFFGLDVRNYRQTHWQHHVHLGDHDDTEISYHNCLSPWFLVSTLTGFHALRVWWRYRATSAERPAGGSVPAWPALLRTVLLHLTFIALLAWAGGPFSAAAWCAATVLVYPCLGSVRQIAEHRHIEAPCSIDFEQSQHGPVNRSFGTGLFACYFGSAGFSRHILHHWDPSVSYSRFDDMEEFLRNTPLADDLAAAQTTYARSFTGLLHAANSTESR